MLPKHRYVEVSIQRQWPGKVVLCTQISIWVSVSGEVDPKQKGKSQGAPLFGLISHKYT